MYQSLYRKYRPKKIEDVVGQNIAVKIIKNSLQNNKINHAYLFSGPRGTGKTTMAKILAKSVNCLNASNGIACEKCKNCLEINSNETVDIIEIDAASNNGVDEVREIRNSVSLSCSSLKYKIYIIDEVHMLTIGAFNALLKTLEEPPEHIIFILATTDIQKVPSTIISRCQCINFESISDVDIKKRLAHIAKEESINLDDEVLMKIAEISNGGLRDAIGNLEKLIAASGDKKINLDEFNTIFGFVDSILLNDFFTAMIQIDIVKILDISTRLYDSGKNYILFINELIEFTRKKIREYYKKNNGYCSYCNLVFELNDLCNNLKNTDNVKALFEAGIINITNSLTSKNKVETTNDIITKKDSLPLQEKTYIPKEQKKPEKQKENPSDLEKKDPKEEKDNMLLYENNKIIINNTFALANKKDLVHIKKDWEKLNDYLLDRDIGSTACYLVDGNIRACGENNLILSYEYDSMVNRGMDMYDSLVTVLNQVLGKKYYISLVTDEDWEKEKQQYINNLKNNIKYEVKKIKEKNDKNPSINLSNNDSLDEASLLFGADIVEIK